ncbi:DNA cytosine methyltransferase [Elizabethkingia anophelis]|uniref:DNA cytosine methyltransferase n=1 Tax=Elizabethkingia anophelis TaxID=1117645 RepID=UPI003891622F
MKILNLYACLGGNRYKWDEVAKAAGINIQVTAVELDPELARLYQERFPNDIVIIADAHQYLLEHYKEFDFVWSSPPCPSHSRARGWNTKVETKYPDMKLYEEIILMETVSKGENPRFKGKYVIENVIPYYEPLIEAQKRGRHLYWTNIKLPPVLSERKGVEIGNSKNEVKKWCEFHDYNFYKYKGFQTTQKIARNLVDYEAGKTILETALNVAPKKAIHSLFDDSVIYL